MHTLRPLSHTLCLQHDNLVPTMTSSESLAFYAGIILPPTTSAKAKRRRIAEVLAMMGLSKHKDTLVRCVLWWTLCRCRFEGQ